MAVRTGVVAGTAWRPKFGGKGGDRAVAAAPMYGAFVATHAAARDVAGLGPVLGPVPEVGRGT